MNWIFKSEKSSNAFTNNIQSQYLTVERLDSYKIQKILFKNLFQRKGRRKITPWQINGGTSWAYTCAGCSKTGNFTPVNIASVIAIAIIIVSRDFLFLRILEHTVCLILALLVDKNEIWLCCLLAELNEVLLLDLSRAVDSWLWCLFADLTEVLLS